MKNLNNKINAYLTDQSGATMIEYALVAALISIAAITMLDQLGNQVSATFKDINKDLKEGRKG